MNSVNVRPDSYMSRTTDFGERSVSSTHGCVSRYSRRACSSGSASGRGCVTSSSSSMRSSYSIPSAFISATASPRSL